MTSEVQHQVQAPKMLSPPYSPHSEQRLKELSDKQHLNSHSSLSEDSGFVIDKNSSAGSSYSNDTDLGGSEYSRTVTPPEDSLSLEGDNLISTGSHESSRARSVSELDFKTYPKSSSDKQQLTTKSMTTCWDALKTNPAEYLFREKCLIELYPLRRHSWVGGSFGTSSFEELEAPPPPQTLKRGRKPNRQQAALKRRRNQPSVVSNSGNSEDESRDTGVKVHDMSIKELEDFAPPVHLLPPGKSLRAEWKGAPMDLSQDKDLHLLHPAEAHLASVLRLPCDVYLDSKRRLFAEKVHRLRQGLPFRRTDSQKACRIDVNKASRLFGAFEKIGWLEDDLFLQYLE